MKAITILLLFIGGIFCCGQQLDEEFYKNLLDKEFTKVLTGQNTNFGTFAGIRIKEDIASFAGNLQIGKSSGINFNIKGGATEGFIPILNGEKVSSNISINAQLNFGMYRNLINRVLSEATSNINYTTYLINLQNETNK